MNKPSAFFVRWKGQQFGPFAKEIIEQKVREHELSLAHEIQVDGKWRSLRGFLNLEAQAQEQEQQKVRLRQMRHELDRTETMIQKTQSQLGETKGILEKAKEKPRSVAFALQPERLTISQVAKTCIKCDATNLPEARFCKTCGFQFLGSIQGTSSGTIGNRPQTQPSEVDSWAILTSSDRSPIASIILASICVGVSLLMLISGSSLFEPTTENLVQWGANYAPLVQSGEWWRLMTSCFVHIGIIHLAMNMWCLISLGALSERLYGSVRFAVLYILAGLGGSIASCMFHPEIVSAGASGAIFGLAGGTLALSVCLKERLPTDRFKNLIGTMLAFVGYNLFYGLIQPHIDNAAHIGGLVTGFLIGLPLAVSVRRELSAGGFINQTAEVLT